MTELDKQIQNGNHNQWVKDQERANDKKWFICILLICAIFTGAIINEMGKVKVIDNTPLVKNYCDSLQNYVDTANGVHVIVHQ